MSRRWTWVALALLPSPALADPQSLSTNVPVQVEDALTTPYGGLTLQNDNRFTRDPHGRGSGNLATSPVVKIGALPGLQIDLGPSYNFGDKGTSGAGNGTIDALYQFNKDSKYVPSFAVHGYYATPYGSGHKSAEYTVRGIATKYLGNDMAPRLHLNLTLYHLTQPGPTQRTDQLEMAVGFSTLVRKDTALVADVVHGALPDKKRNETFIDVGLRHEITDTWAIAGGVGVGVAQESPGFRMFFALQKDFKLF
jgi:hypothetical protein